MNAKRILVTGSSGLIGGEVVSFMTNRGYQVHGIDNNQREQFFGPNGSTRETSKRLLADCKGFTHYDVDIRDREQTLSLIKYLRPTAVVHTAAQPSHDLAAKIPFEDFEVNAVGTLNLLEGVRQYAADSPFVHLSTNKVYGDSVNRLPRTEQETRWEFADDTFEHGIPETFSIDQSKHSLFGASKLAADILVQEYGQYFGIPTCTLRGGCLTGPHHAGVELHGFLSYLIKCNVNGNMYTVYGYKGKQVRDNIHSYDVASFINEFINAPRIAEVYNLGGGRQNSISLLESFELAERVSGKRMNYTYTDVNREGDHIIYYSDLRKLKNHYPQWQITKDLSTIFCEIYQQHNNTLVQ
jgi:CDP-paratose 2-epimerase